SVRNSISVLFLRLRTVLCSRASGLSRLRRLDGGVRVRARDPDMGDAVAPAPSFQGLDLQALDARVRTVDGHSVDELREQSADAVDVVLVDLDVEVLGEVRDRHAGADDE